MQRMVVGTLEAVSGLLAGLLVAVAVVAGMITDGAFGAVVGLIGGLLAATVIFGVLFVFLEINQNLRAIRASLESRAAG